MKNLEAKQEAIKKAYGEYWELVKDYVDENGICENWSSFRDEKTRIFQPKECDTFGNGWRPKSLQGIEHNNGWIRIDDFVKYTNEKFWIFNSHINDLYQGQLFDDDMFPINRYATHYQPIEKPKLPIY